MAKKIKVKDLFGASNENMIQTDYATLFIDRDEPAIPVPQEMQEALGGIDEIPMEGLQSNKSVNFTLYYTDFMHEGSELHEIYHTLRMESDQGSQLTTRLASPGGYVLGGMQLINLAKEQFKGRHTTVLEAGVASMAAVTFAAGDTRVCYESSSYMLHDFNGMTYGSGGNILKQAEHKNKFIDTFFRGILVDTGFISEEEFKELKTGGEAYYETPELVLRGIATHVIVQDVIITGEEYLEYYDSGLSFDEFSEIKSELEAAERSDIDMTDPAQIAELIANGQLQIQFQ